MPTKPVIKDTRAALYRTNMLYDRLRQRWRERYYNGTYHKATSFPIGYHLLVLRK